MEMDGRSKGLTTLENKQPDGTMTEGLELVTDGMRSLLLDTEMINESRLRTEYDIIKLVGEGAFGKVFLATIKSSGERCALKTITCTDATTLVKAKEEAKILAKLQKNVNIIRYQDSWVETTTEKMFYIQMEYFEGTTLSSQIEIGVEPNRVWMILEQLAQALSDIYGKGIAHCDLHSRNILINDKYCLKIIDFGQAKRLESTGHTGCDAKVIKQDLKKFGSIALDLYFGPFQSLSDRTKTRLAVQREGSTRSEFSEDIFPSEEQVIGSLIKPDYGNLPKPQVKEIEPEDILSDSKNFFQYQDNKHAISMGIVALRSLALALTEATGLFVLFMKCVSFLLYLLVLFFICMLRTINYKIYETIERKAAFEAAYRKIYELVLYLRKKFTYS